jgi:hypothetical protein
MATRGLKKSPGFLAVVILSLALGIGANSTIFSVIDNLLYRPLPYDDPQQLTTIWETQLSQPDSRQPPMEHFRSRMKSLASPVELKMGDDKNKTEAKSGKEMTEPSDPVRAAQRSRTQALIVPREHGAWDLLLVPLFTGVVAGFSSELGREDTVAHGGGIQFANGPADDRRNGESGVGAA